MQFTNFYETVKEAQLRLNRTLVLYDGQPYFVLCISDHKADGIFRIYLDSTMHKDGCASGRIPNIPYDSYDEGNGNNAGTKMDAWLEKNPDKGIIRKMMNSPLFNKFRPFPLGMVNQGGGVVYTERTPTRSTLQGLSQNMVSLTTVELLSGAPGESRRGRRGVDLRSISLARTIVNDYPSAEECLKGLSDPRVANEGAAFHRNFALLRGPLDMMFLAYKGDVIGLLPNHDLSSVCLGQKYNHCKEAVAELDIFANIKTR